MKNVFQLEGNSNIVAVPYSKFMVINSKIIIIKLIDKILYSEKILFFYLQNLSSSKVIFSNP